MPNGRAGEATTIEILLKDALGNPAADRASAIALSVVGANSIGSLNATDRGGGRYTASYTPQATGTDQVTILVSGAGLSGSPFSSQVVPGSTSAAQSFAVVPARVSIFAPFTITITALDQFGNEVGHGGDPFELRIDDGAPRTVTDNGDGTYSVAIAAFSLSVATHQVFVSLAGTPIKGSPYSMEVTFF